MDAEKTILYYKTDNCFPPSTISPTAHRSVHREKETADERG